jgi:hypothetical protein
MHVIESVAVVFVYVNELSVFCCNCRLDELLVASQASYREETTQAIDTDRYSGLPL